MTPIAVQVTAELTAPFAAAPWPSCALEDVGAAAVSAAAADGVMGSIPVHVLAQLKQ
jgi:hypothetical protein